MKKSEYEDRLGSLCWTMAQAADALYKHTQETDIKTARATFAEVADVLAACWRKQGRVSMISVKGWRILDNLIENGGGAKSLGIPCTDETQARSMLLDKGGKHSEARKKISLGSLRARPGKLRTKTI